MNINPEIIGYVAGGLSSALFVPQILKILKVKDTEEISLLMCLIGVVSSGLWLWFGIKQNHLSMITTNSISVVATVVLLILKFIYRKNQGKSL